MLKVLDCVRSCLTGRVAELWDAQIQAINKMQRSPAGDEVDFYRIRNGRPSFDEALAFPNQTPELLLAEVQIEHLSSHKRAW